ncbi:unnamed protein product [Rhizoctonia solani]|uniref:F-box domain-containing protein n=1 Tax=Rhizoctonia solani TaxID=456999 RepID=A0A8H2XQX7_9AGAM|nr:unnamed protein product [Rhizoctonia solani]CAE7195773.1 unnamed protein product [Rhizoctonia solani]
MNPETNSLTLNNDCDNQPHVPHSFRTRERSQWAIPTTIYHLPDEILASIFTLVINDLDPEYTIGFGMEMVLRSTYQRLLALTVVCSDWRRICLSKGSLWSTVPVFNHPKTTERALKTCLERSRGCDIYLAGRLGAHSEHVLLEVIPVQKHRIHTIDLKIEGTKFLPTLSSILVTLLVRAADIPRCLTNLFVRIAGPSARSTRPTPKTLLYGTDSVEHNIFDYLAPSLKGLRLSGFNLDWNEMRLSGLVELRVQDLYQVSRSMMDTLLYALSSAPKLQTVELIEISFRSNPVLPPESVPEPSYTISLPSLQKLYMQDVDHEFLSVILQSIAPGPYRTIVHYSNLRYVDRYRYHNGEREATGINLSQLGKFEVDTLVLSSSCFDYFRTLGEVPTIQALYITNTTLSESALRALVRPEGCTKTSFPTIRRLYILNSAFEHQFLDLLKAVVESHGIQELRIGTPDFAYGDAESIPGWVLFEGPLHEKHTAPIISWLQNNVQKFVIVKRLKDLPDLNLVTEFW